MEETINNLTTKEKIIEAALEIIASEGFQKVTIRKIATMAGVNIAAVNYHFGSKEKVLNEALEHVMIQMKKIFNYLKDEEHSPEVRLEIFIQKYSKILFTYPDPVKNLIHQSIHEHSVSNNFQEYLKFEGIELIKNTIHQLRPEENDSILYMLTMQLLSSLAFPVLLGNRAVDIFGIELNQTDNQRAYTKLLVKNILR
ncbi:TetR/AcrR family transcriptional regulator [Desulfosporosinus fructosivorans]|uniref:TetR/AcrR family transcriptional regulator n=1 Tax=Desulfosporosinus fructosivorans TaxID=2018669 RepID=A0A4Z0R3N4_9FIRM|nr:TetR/AcrR family transcriptional regulator [Desulfosporosinus fructosivorans]TGE37398.1 TetR/AcrR family transcriptional regulator [Desulfosporosinus fructosivorans]